MVTVAVAGAAPLLLLLLQVHRDVLAMVQSLFASNAAVEAKKEEASRGRQ
jgi:hypothetical protein